MHYYNRNLKQIRRNYKNPTSIFYFNKKKTLSALKKNSTTNFKEKIKIKKLQDNNQEATKMMNHLEKKVLSFDCEPRETRQAQKSMEAFDFEVE